MFLVTMDGPKKNALGTPMMRFLLGQIGQAGGQPILLTGTGDAFSAGLDLKEIASLDAAGMESFLRLLDTLMTTLFAYPAPTVAVVNGHAIAGGCILALCCDHRVAPDVPGMRIGLNEIALGLRFPPKLLTIVRRRVAPPAIERVVLGADLFDPRAALRLGLLDEIADDPHAAAERHLAMLASYPAVAYAAAKSELRGALVVSAEEEQRFLEEVLPSWTSPDLKTRVLAALARR
jgi:enoyl-CoA hydratase/carnithine racemase